MPPRPISRVIRYFSERTVPIGMDVLSEKAIRTKLRTGGWVEVSLFEPESVDNFGYQMPPKLCLPLALAVSLRRLAHRAVVSADAGFVRGCTNFSPPKRSRNTARRTPPAPQGYARKAPLVRARLARGPKRAA